MLSLVACTISYESIHCTVSTAVIVSLLLPVASSYNMVEGPQCSNAIRNADGNLSWILVTANPGKEFSNVEILLLWCQSLERSIFAKLARVLFNGEYR